MENSLKEQVIRYVNLITMIRRLSSISSSEVADADDYGRKLRENFFSISGLGDESREIVSTFIRPVLQRPGQLSSEEEEALYLLCEKLLDPYTEEELDLVILDEAAKRLLEDAIKKGDDDNIIHAMYVYINACYANVVRTNRVRVNENLSRRYRNAGVKVAREMLGYLEHDAFSKISEESRRYVLIHSRFYLALYDTFYVEEQTNEERINGLWRSYELSEDSFYTELTPNYDWNYHRIRCLENMGQLTERGNAWKFNDEQLKRIYEGVLKLEEIWVEDPVGNNKILPRVQLELECTRNAYFAGAISKEEYEDDLMKRYITSSNQNYDSYSLIGNILIPVEFLTVIDCRTITEEKAVFIEKMYLQLIDYVQHSTNTEAFYFLLDYLTSFLEAFVELPGCINFEEMTLSCLASIHPPTYVHSLQVAQISRCLGRHLFAKHPNLLGDKSEDKALEILYRSALCHDFGKISMLDTIFVYGRTLSELEFTLIKEHPAMSAYMLEKYPSSRSIATIAAGHHIWHDGKGGYLEGNRVAEDKQIFVDIISIADSIDAATDVIGRNYSKGKELHEIIDEIRSLEDSRYSSEVVSILEDSDVYEDLDFLINKGRDINYRNTYLLLFKNAGSKE